MAEVNVNAPKTRRGFLEFVGGAVGGTFAGLLLGNIGGIGPNSQAFTGAYLQKKPPNEQFLDAVSGPTTLVNRFPFGGGTDNLNLVAKSVVFNPGVYTFGIDPETGGILAAAVVLINPAQGGVIGPATLGLGTVPSNDNPPANSAIFGDPNTDNFFQGENNLPSSAAPPIAPFTHLGSYNFLGSQLREIVLSTEEFDASNPNPPVSAPATLPRCIFIDRGSFGGHIDRFAWRENTTPTNLNHGLSFEIDGPTGATPNRSTRLGFAGVSTHLSPIDHAHPIDAISINGFLKTAVGAGLPLKFLRFKFELPVTIRRLSVYAQNPPTGGTDTFGVVNAAGTLQGTAVALATGIKENETGVQTTGLAATTIYYLAQTASTSAVQSTDINLVLEYTLT